MKKIFILLLSCGMFSADPVIAKNKTAENNLIGATKVGSIEFDKGKAILTERNKKALNEMLSGLDKETIAQVKILAWGDNEATVNQDLTSPEATLAEQRAEVVKEFVSEAMKDKGPSSEDRLLRNDDRLAIKDLEIVDIDVHNMAERPSDIAQFFKTDDYELKKSKGKPEWKSNGGPMKALVMIVPENK